MDTKTIDSIKEVMAPIAQKIGEKAEWSWIIVIKQMYVVAVEGGLWAILGIVGLIISIILYRKGLKRTRKDDYDDGSQYYGPAILIGGLSLFALILGTGTMVTHLINPDFYALQFFIDLVK